MALPISSRIAPETTEQKLFKTNLQSNTMEGSKNIVPPLVTPGDRLNNGLPGLSPVPIITESSQTGEEYQESVNQRAMEQGVTREALNRVEGGGGPNVGAAGQRLRYLGNYDDGGSVLAPASKQLISDEADRLTPSISPDALKDVSVLHLATEQNNPGYLTASRTGKAIAKIDSIANFLIDETQEGVDARFEALADKLVDPQGKVDVNVLAHIAAYTMGSALSAQNSFTSGRRESQEPTVQELSEIGVPMEERSIENQIGMNQEQIILSMSNRARSLYEIANPNHKITSEEFQVLATKLFQRIMEEGELVTTQINDNHVLLPAGSDNTGSLLGTASDLMVGVDRKAGNSLVSTIAGATATDLPALSHNKVSKSFPGTETNSSMVAANVYGRIPRGMFENGMKVRVYELSDVMSKMIFPDPNAIPEYQSGELIDPKKHLMYSTSKFASTFKMDLDTAVAAYRSKIYLVGKASKDSDVATSRQQIEQIAVVNSINNTRLNNTLVDVSKQLKLVNEKGFAQANNAFFPSLGIADVNGRMSYTAHDGAISGDKANARQLQKFKELTRTIIPTGRKAHAAHSRKITSAANKLFAHEGNNRKFQAALDGMDKATISEIAFRCIMVGQLLIDGNSANKKNARGVPLTETEKGALRFLTDTQMAGVTNVTYAVQHQIYLEINESDPIALESYFGKQGAAIENELDSMNPKLETLVVPEFILNESARERTKRLIEGWGPIEMDSDSAIEEYASGRGDMQANMTIRADALKYMQAYEGTGTNGFYWDFTVSIDARMSGSMLQASFAPTEHSAFTQDMLGKLPNSTLGDLRDFAEGLALNKDTIKASFSNDSVAIDAWHGFLQNALQGDKASISRELFLKQPIMQFFFGKPKNMNMGHASDLLGYFTEDIKASEYLSGLTPDELVTQLNQVIEAVLSDNQFNSSFSDAMKDLGLYLAMTGSDLVIKGPFGDQNLSVEALEYVFRSKDITAYKKGLPEELEPAFVEMMIKGYDERGNATKTPLIHYIRTKQRTPQGTKGSFRQDEFISGDNQRVGPGKRTSDSLAVLLTHQIESGILNYTVAEVNKNRKPENFVPIVTVFDNVLTTGEGYFRYGHTYNNEAFDVLHKWDVFEALNDMVSKANEKFLKERSKDWKGRPVKGGGTAEHYNISVMQGSDGQTHRVERYSPLTAWLDKYYLNMPNKYDYPDPKMLAAELIAHKNNKKMGKAITAAEGSGYQAPIINEFYLENGYLPADQALVLNAAERANMFLNKASFDKLMLLFTTATKSNFNKMAKENKFNKERVIREQGGKRPNMNLQQ